MGLGKNDAQSGARIATQVIEHLQNDGVRFPRPIGGGKKSKIAGNRFGCDTAFVGGGQGRKRTGGFVGGLLGHFILDAKNLLPRTGPELIDSLSKISRREQCYRDFSRGPRHRLQEVPKRPVRRVKADQQKIGHDRFSLALQCAMKSRLRDDFSPGEGLLEFSCQLAPVVGTELRGRPACPEQKIVRAEKWPGLAGHAGKNRIVRTLREFLGAGSSRESKLGAGGGGNLGGDFTGEKFTGVAWGPKPDPEKRAAFAHQPAAQIETLGPARGEHHRWPRIAPRGLRLFRQPGRHDGAPLFLDAW